MTRVKAHARKVGRKRIRVKAHKRRSKRRKRSQNFILVGSGKGPHYWVDTSGYTGIKREEYEQAKRRKKKEKKNYGSKSRIVKFRNKESERLKSLDIPEGGADTKKTDNDFTDFSRLRITQEDLERLKSPEFRAKLDWSSIPDLDGSWEDDWSEGFRRNPSGSSLSYSDKEDLKELIGEPTFGTFRADMPATRVLREARKRDALSRLKMNHPDWF